MAINEYPQTSYGFSQPLVQKTKDPLIYDRAPTVKDLTDLARPWLDKSTGIYYILTAKSGSPLQATWTAVADATPDGTNGQLYIGRTGLTPVWANLATDGTIGITEGAGTITLSVVGATSASFVTDAGTATPLAGVTQFAGGTNINTARTAVNQVTINLDDDVTLVGALTAGTSVTAGADLTMTTGTCTITSDDDIADCIYLHANAGTSETIRIRSDQGTGNNSVTVTSDVGSVNINSGRAAANAIILNASNAAGGIDADYGTGACTFTGANGAFTVITGTGAISLGADAAAKTITIGNSTGATAITCDVGTGDAKFGTTATAHDTYLGSTTTTAGTIVQSGTGDVTITSTDAIFADATGVLELNSSAGVIGIGNDAVNQNINVGTAGNRTVTMGVTGGTTSVALDSGSGGTALSSDGIISSSSTGATTLDSSGNMEINSSAGLVQIAHDNIDQNVNIATAGNRTVTIGLTGGTSTLSCNSGSGGTTITSDGTTDIDSVGALAINSDATISIATDADNQDVDIATAGNRTISIGVAGGTSTLNLDSGSGGTAINSDGTIEIHSTNILSLNSDATINLGSDGDDQAVNIATAGNRTVSIGATGGTTSIALDSGSGNTALNSDGTTTIDATGNVEINSTALVQIAHDAIDQNVNIATAGNRTVSIGATGGTSTLVLDSGSGGTTITSDGTTFIDSVGALAINSNATISIATDADDQNVSIATAGNRTISLGVAGGTSTLNLDSGSGGTAMDTDGTFAIAATGAISADSTGGAINIATGANAQDVNVCTGAAARNLVAGSTNTTSSTTIQAGTGGIALNASGIATVEPATATAAGVALTIDANVGWAIFTGQTTAAAAQVTLTITNSICTADSVILATVSNKGANDARMTLERVKPAAGSFTLDLQNNGAAALNGDIVVAFWILKA